jgi:methyltransferase
MFGLLMCYLIAQRGTELLLAARNSRWAVTQGGREYGRRLYHVIVAMHGLFFISLVAEHHYYPGESARVWPLWLALLMAAQALRMWSAVCLGRSWNTRVVVVPGASVIKSGPYRFLRHPVYLAVIAEFIAVPLLCGAWVTAVVFTVANAVVIAFRIRQEETALRLIGGTSMDHLPRLLPRFPSSRPRRKKTENRHD